VTVALLLAGAATAQAASTLTVAPGSSRQLEPCTAATPCEWTWAVSKAAVGDTVAFNSGEYTYTNPSKSLSTSGVNLEPSPAATTRPLIRQTVAFATCNCAVIEVSGKGVIRGLEVEQAAGTAGHAAGAIALGGGAVAERDILRGVADGMYIEGTAEIDDTLIVAGAGAAVYDVEDGAPTLNNVTAIGKGAEGVGLSDVNGFGGTVAFTATNTILRGEKADAEAYGVTGTASIVLHYSDARTAYEKLIKGSGAESITDTDHPTHGEPVFAAGGYEEAAGSPTIDAGTLDPASGSLDLAGLPRVLGAATDIGAYEYQPPAVKKEEPPKQGPPAKPPVPALLALTQSHTRWRAGARLPALAAASARRAPLGTTFSFSLNTPASVTFTFRRLSSGRRSARGCVAPTPRNRRARACTRRLNAGALTLSVPAGSERLAFFGRLSASRRLKPGRYTVSVLASNASGSSKAASLSFTIL
jgi:hypothetical protein